jgi:hypothetical protein
VTGLERVRDGVETVEKKNGVATGFYQILVNLRNTGLHCCSSMYVKSVCAIKQDLDAKMCKTGGHSMFALHTSHVLLFNQIGNPFAK